ncbi:MAG TPA: hypothetical protein VIF57_10255 [Polyangia bacterium]|jgi:hypothetical protein
MGARAASLALAAGAVVASPATTRADAKGYDEVRDVVAEDGQLRVVHHHDWSEATRSRRWKMISGDQDPFSPRNDYSWLTVTDKKTGQTLFRSPVPALTQLWISPDSRYVLGLSHVKLWNPYQVVLFDRAGRLLLKRRIEPEEARFTPADFDKLLRRYPKARAELARLSHREGDAVYVDLDDPRRLHGAWDALYAHLRPSHLSPNFSGSVTNFVYWFNAQPKPRLIESEGRPTALELRDPRGQPFQIPIPR